MFQRMTGADLGRDDRETHGSLSFSPAPLVSMFSAVTADEEDFTERPVCWDLEKRGVGGETGLHLCLLFSKEPMFRKISFELLKVFPKLSVDIYEDDEHYGK